MATIVKKQGLYNPENEHDSCGIGFVANIKNKKSHRIIQQGLSILCNVTHRGAVGADPLVGDGVGVLIQIPDNFFREILGEEKIFLPDPGHYGVGMIFLPRPSNLRKECEKVVEKFILKEGQELIAWRNVPLGNPDLGKIVKSHEPVIKQIFIKRSKNCGDQDSFERRLFVIRKQIENFFGVQVKHKFEDFYITSFSSRTIVYKGMILSRQIREYFKDLLDSRVESALALVHQRFSTNTFPSWKLAQPFRLLCHNGEINTLRGNLNWMNARKYSMTSEILGKDLKKIWPLIQEGQSDSACIDNALELLLAGGYSLAHAMMMLIPEAWSGNNMMDEKRKAFYEYHAAFTEAWDGPAAIAFTDGKQIGGTLDRNGLRPSRYFLTDDDTVILASETGVLDVPEEKIIKKWRLEPGKMFLIDLEEKRIISDDEIKEKYATRKPYKAWLKSGGFKVEDLPVQAKKKFNGTQNLLDCQQAFGYTQEDVDFFLKPMLLNGEEPVGSMGVDTAPAVLSRKPKSLYNYFKQCFAQVTNPAIDPIREQLVMSLVSFIGPKPNLLGVDEDSWFARLEVKQPIITGEEIEKIRYIKDSLGKHFRSITVDICYPYDEGLKKMGIYLEKLCKKVELAIRGGYNIIILSDRKMNMGRVAIPALLATSAVHHHLIKKGLRTKTGLVVETGEVCQLHHFAVLAGYGAEAINPYLAFETLNSLADQMSLNISQKKIEGQYIKAVNKAMLKIMSKMGISTYQSYCGAQIFDSIGLSSIFVKKYFTGTATPVEGIGIEEIACETFKRHELAFGTSPIYKDSLDVGGELAYRIRGEDHIWAPDTVSNLQHAVRGNIVEKYQKYSDLINSKDKRFLTFRGLFEFRTANKKISLNQVEPAKKIVKRFATGAMSFGSISREAHTNLAIAMNRIGGKSNTGEGGEERNRFQPLKNGDSMRSAIKQVASGRFGVTTEYLVNADDIQIKICQGAKPGEGGQLPGYKVDSTIASVRYSTPGVGLISPPPHHDIYSIEDLAQLIFDLKNVNPYARISVKLASEIGVGTVAAGVAKCKADHVTIAGYEGGTGASPITSIRHAGLPWEIGLAETHQTLVLNGLRGRIAVQVDGGFRTGRDVVIGAILGADEFGFSTAPLISSGCIMMRKCHLNTCPVGVATQDPVLRKKFAGKPEHVINYFFFVAEEVRKIMANLGLRKFHEMIGNTDCLNTLKAIDHWKANGLDFSKLLTKPKVKQTISFYNSERQKHEIQKIADRKLIRYARHALEKKRPVSINMKIKNTDRSFGAMLSGEIARRYGHQGLPEDTISVHLTGTAGQSFGAFLSRGVSLELKGDTNDYVGKGLSGGRIVIYPHENSPLKAEENIIVGNTVLYGAIAGECFFSGVAGERFAVRNSGAIAVVEGAGDHCCEYMTGGVVVVLGKTGRNFAAGMSGGVAYVFDVDGDFSNKCNLSMVVLQSVKKEKNSRSYKRNGHFYDMTRFDEARIRGLVEQHLHYTNSNRARKILGNWNEYLPNFIKIMPTDFQKALIEMKAKKADSHKASKLNG